jgi:Tol biopolymer transport system component
VSRLQPTGYQNLWVTDLLRGSTTRLTLEQASHVDPRWSPDGRQVIFGSTRDPSRSPFKVSLPTSEPTQVFNYDGGMFSLDDWSPDGRHLLYHDAGQPELWALPLDGEREPMLVARSLSGFIDQAQFSPDGSWIAYNTNESGRPEVMVVPFPPTGDKYQISTTGGVQATWRSDGRQLYFLAPDSTLMAVDVRPGKIFEWGDARPLFKTQLSISDQMEQYAPDPEGNRFLFVKPTEESLKAPFTVILNWSSLLKK